MNKDLLETAVEGFRRLIYWLPAYPEVAQIEITNRCNFSCPMCQRRDLGVALEHMGLETYKEIIERLGKVREVILTGWGEPLCHPDIFKMIKYAKNHGKTTGFTSNGSLLTKSAGEKLIEAGLDNISFSIDEVNPAKSSFGHPLTDQLINIENFAKLPHRPKIIIQPTLHSDREENIFAVTKWAAGVGAEMVNINRLDTRFNPSLRRPGPKEEKEFVKKLDRLGEKYGIRVEFRPHTAFSGLARKIYRAIIPFMHRGGKHCLRVYNYIYVNLKGEITPCCALPLWSVGNIFKEDLEIIWKSERFQQFRRHDFQRTICGRCDVLEIKQYGET